MTDVKPDYICRVVKDVGGKDKWTDVGVAYINARGSITIYLSALPLNDKILLIPSSEAQEQWREFQKWKEEKEKERP